MATAAQEITKDGIFSFRYPSSVLEIVDALVKKRKWSRSLLYGEIFHEGLIRELKKEGGFEKEIEFLKTLR